MFKKKRFRLCLYVNDSFIIVQRRVCFIWINLVDDDGEIMRFNNVVEAEQWLHTQKKFGEVYIIDYRKISY